MDGNAVFERARHREALLTLHHLLLQVLLLVLLHLPEEDSDVGAQADQVLGQHADRLARRVGQQLVEGVHVVVLVIEGALVVAQHREHLHAVLPVQLRDLESIKSIS